jgi:quinol monooxygenase YgiN
METLAILAVLEAKPGKEGDVEAFLRSALSIARSEPGTISWYALKLGTSRFGIFDTFADSTGRDAHLTGELAAALFAAAEDLFVAPPVIEHATIIAVKPCGGLGR